MIYHSSTTWVCSVAVATVWTSPESVRQIDAPGFENPVRLPKWLEALNYEDLLDLCEDNRVQTQVLYGEPVLIDEIVGDWAKVNCIWQFSKKDERGYPGWIPLAQLKEMERISDFGYAKVRLPKVQLFSKHREPLLVVPFNTILPVIDDLDDHTVVHTPHGDALILSEDIERAPGIESFIERIGVEVVSCASKFVDIPYFWGGMSSYGYDCSGFSYNMFKGHGYFIPRDADDQAKHGEEIDLNDTSQWEVGDLLFFANEGSNKVRHVGIYYGNGQMIHSPSTGQSVEIIILAGTKYAKELCAVSRYARTEEESL
ncbi:C40 family peptidase [Paenisporosarcina antarctica]|uniref:NlpC/P60 family protein n=1 Tax=Paenisporosarcina antarctica TaxID=417367 RepID=A0A4P7A1A1_9BACL|nr:C40 family peptidase [Paenisporosarcina antarctica]QBP42800.1 NlpC/P60 family protein [Paenisporosarcina antarctica]